MVVEDEVKATVVLLVLGAIGILQYVGVQLTSLAYKYEVVVIGQAPDGGDMLGVNVTRDWTVGLVGLIIGVVLLGIGVYRFSHHRNITKPGLTN